MKITNIKQSNHQVPNQKSKAIPQNVSTLFSVENSQTSLKQKTKLKSPQKRKSLPSKLIQANPTIASPLKPQSPNKIEPPPQQQPKSILKKSNKFSSEVVKGKEVQSRNSSTRVHSSPKAPAKQESEKIRQQVVKAFTPPRPISGRARTARNSSSPKVQQNQINVVKDIYESSKILLPHASPHIHHEHQHEHQNIHHKEQHLEHHQGHHQEHHNYDVNHQQHHSQKKINQEVYVDDNMQNTLNHGGIEISGILGHTFAQSGGVQHLPWIKDHRYYITSANKYVQINKFAEQGTSQILLEQPTLIKSLGVCGFIFYVLLQDRVLQLYDAASQQLIKSIYLNCTEVLSLTTSLCQNYVLALVSQDGQITPHIRIIQLSSGMVLTSSILQGASIRQKIFVEFVGTQYDLQFVILSSALTQLWRVSAKGTLEFMDLECARNSEARSACTVIHDNCTYLVIGQGYSLTFFDLRQARLVVEASNITKQPIIQLIASNQNLMILTSSPNIYYFKIFGSIANLLENTSPSVISLDSQPVAHSSLHDHELIIAAKSGQIWFIDLNEKITLKLQTGVDQNSTINQAQYLKSTHLVVSASSNGTVTVQDTKTHETIIDFLAPRRNCLSVVVFDLKRIIAAGYDDAMIRFFSLDDNSVIGNSKLPSTVTQLSVITKHLALLAGTHCGQIFILTLIQDKQKFRVIMHPLKTEIGSPVGQIIVNHIDYANIWAFSNLEGSVMIHERKKLNEQDIVLDKNHHHHNQLHKSGFDDLAQLEYYLVDQVRKTSRIFEHAIKIQFSDVHSEIIMIGQEKQIKLRNFREHMDIKYIDLSVRLSAFIIQDTKIIVLSEDSKITLYDQDSLNEIDRKQLFEGNNINLHAQSRNVVCYQNLVIFYSISL